MNSLNSRRTGGREIQMSGQPNPQRLSIPAGRPAQIAKDMLSHALASLQDIQTPGLDVQDLTGKIAKSVGALYAVQFTDPADPGHVAGVQNALAFLGQALGSLQDLQSEEAAVMDTSRIIARVMAILYPVSRAQDQASQPQPIVERKPSREIPHHPERTAPRVACEVDIGFQSESNFFTGFSEDISEGGLFISTYDFKTIGTEIDVNFTLPSGHTVIAQGVVRWIRELNPLTPEMEPGMGVQFIGLGQDDKDAINTYLDQRSPMFYEE
jgi:uncharacterized protein (TIGR02266 family)